MKDLTIIIPVFNCEDEIVKTIESVRTKLENSSIIVINDGSKDKTYEVLENNYGNFKNIAILNKVNGGVSSARNLGIEKTKTKLIMFVDAGDIINEGVIEFVKKSEKYPSNLTIAGHTQVRGKDRREVLPYENIAVDLNEFLENSNGEKYYLFLQFPWGKIYQTEIINQYGIRFDETIDYAEDALFIFEYLKYLDNVSFFLYHFMVTYMQKNHCLKMFLQKNQKNWIK